MWILQLRLQNLSRTRLELHRASIRITKAPSPGEILTEMHEF